MTYADTNFFIGLMDPSNDLHKNAKKIYEENKENIETSLLTLAELLVGCEIRDIDPEVIVGSIFQLAVVSGITLEESMRAAHYMKDDKLTTFDALHCAIAGNQIISNDKDLDKTGIRRES